MPKAVIVGGRGQAGWAVGQRLVQGGWSVTATSSVAQPGPTEKDEVRWVQFVRDENSELSQVIPAGTDLVVDVTAYTPAHGQQLLALKERIGAAIVMSTISVYSDAAGRSLDEAADEASFPAWPVPIPEDWVRLAPGDQNYSTRKVALENTLRESAPWPLTIIRPGAIHGRHSHHLREWYFIKRALDGRRQVVLPFSGASIFQPTASANLAELVLRAAEQPGNRTLNCGDLDPPSVAQISEIVDALMDHPTERVLVSGPEPEPTVGNHPWATPRPVVVDMARAKLEIGYQQPLSYADALADTISWAVEATAGRDWRDVFSRLAAYPTDLFDYQSEDAFLSRLAERGRQRS
ncbi:MAG: NAD(P)-dependent oxidoreductase [Candidatus Dormiibacterota bacterium]